MTEKNPVYPRRHAVNPIYGTQIKIFAGNELGDGTEEVRYLKALAQTDTGTIYHLPYLRYYFLGNHIVYQDSNVMLSIPPEYHYLRPFLVENSALAEDSAPNVKLRFCTKHGEPLEASYFREVHEFVPLEIKTDTAPSCTNIQYLKTHTDILQDVASAIDNTTNVPPITYAEGPIYKLMHDEDDHGSYEKSVYLYDISHKENPEVPARKVGKLFHEGMVFKMCEDGFSFIHLRGDMYGDDSPLKPTESIHINWKEILREYEESFDIINTSLESFPVYVLIDDRKTFLSKDLPPGITLVEDPSLAIALLKQVKLLTTEGSDAPQSSLLGQYAIPIHVGHALEKVVSSDYEGISARKITVILKESEISLSPREEWSIIPIFLDEKQQFMYAPCIIEKTEDNNLITLCDTANTVAEPVSYSSELLRSFTKKNFPYYISKTPSYTHIDEEAAEPSPSQEAAPVLPEELFEEDQLDEDQWETDGDYVQLWNAPVYVESAVAEGPGKFIPGGDAALLRRPRDVGTAEASGGNQPSYGSVFIGKAIPLSMDVLQDTQDVLYYVGIAFQNGIKREISPYGYFFLDELLVCRSIDGNTVEIPAKYQFLKAVPTRLSTGDIRYKFVFSDKDGTPITPSELDPTLYVQSLDSTLPRSITDVMPYVSGPVPNLATAEHSGPTFSIAKKGSFAILADTDGKEVGRLENNLMFLRIHRDSTNTPQAFLHLDDEAIPIPLRPAKPPESYSSAYLYLSPSGLSLHVGQKMLSKATINATLVKSDESLQNFISSLEDFLLHGKLPSEGISAIKLSLQQMPDSPNLLEVKAMLRRDTYRDLEVANGKLLIQKASHILVHTVPDQEPRILCSHASDILPLYVPHVYSDNTENDDSIITLKKGVDLRVRNSTLLSDLRNIPTHYTFQHKSEHEIPPVEEVSGYGTEPEAKQVEPPIPDQNPKAVSDQKTADKTQPDNSEPESTPEPEAEPESTDKPEAQPSPEPQPDPESTDKPEPKPEPQPEAEPEDTTAPEPESADKPDPEPSPEPQSEPEPQPVALQPEAEPTPGLEPEPAPNPEPVPQSTDKPEPESADKPEPQPDPEPEPDPTPAPANTTDPEPEPAAEPEPESEPQPDPEPEAEPEDTTAPEPEPNPEPSPEPTPQSEPEPADKPDPQPEAKPEPEPAVKDDKPLDAEVPVQPPTLPLEPTQVDDAKSHPRGRSLPPVTKSTDVAKPDNSEPESTPKPEPEPESADKPQPQPSPEPQPDPEPEAKPEDTTDPEPDTQPSPEPKPEPEAEPDNPEPESQPEAKPEPDPEAESESAPEPAVKDDKPIGVAKHDNSEPEDTADQKPESTDKPEPEPESTPEPEAKPEPESADKPDPEPSPEPQSEPEPNPEPTPEPDNPEPEPITDSAPEPDPTLEPENTTDPEPEPQPDPEPEPQPEPTQVDDAESHPRGRSLPPVTKSTDVAKPDNSEPESTPKPEPEPESADKPDPQPEAEPEPEPESAPEPQPEPTQVDDAESQPRGRSLPPVTKSTDDKPDNPEPENTTNPEAKSTDEPEAEPEPSPEPQPEPTPAPDPEPTPEDTTDPEPTPEPESRGRSLAAGKKPPVIPAKPETSLPNSEEKPLVASAEAQTLQPEAKPVDDSNSGPSRRSLPTAPQDQTVTHKSADKPVGDDQRPTIELEDKYGTQGIAVQTFIARECIFPPFMAPLDNQITNALVQELEIVLPQDKIHLAVQSEDNLQKPTQAVPALNPQDTTALNSEENVASQHPAYTTPIQNKLQLQNPVASFNPNISESLHSKSNIYNTLPVRLPNANSRPYSSVFDALSAHTNINLYEGSKMTSNIQPGRIISASPTINKYRAVLLNADGTTTELSPYKYQVLQRDAPYPPMLVCETSEGQQILIDKSFFFLKAITEFHDGNPIHRFTFCDENGVEISPNDITYTGSHNLEKNFKYNSPGLASSSRSLPEPLHSVLISSPTEYAERSMGSIIRSQGNGPTFEIKVDNEEFGIYEFNSSERIGALNSRPLYFSTVNDEENTYFLHHDTHTSKIDAELSAKKAPTAKFFGITPKGVVIYTDRSAAEYQIPQVAKSPEDYDSFVKAITSYLLRGELPQNSMAVEFTPISIQGDKSRSGLSDINVTLDNGPQLLPAIGNHRLLFSEKIFGILYISEDTNEGGILCDNTEETILGNIAPLVRESSIAYGADVLDIQHTPQHQPLTKLASISLNLTLNDDIYTNPNTHESLFPIYAVKKLSDAAGSYPDPTDSTLIRLPVPQYVSLAQDVLFLHPESKYSLKLAPEHMFVKVTYDGSEYALIPCDKNGVPLSRHTDFSDSPDTYCNSSSNICSQVLGGTKEYSKFLHNNENLNLPNYTKGITADEMQKSLREAYADQMHVGSPYFFEITVKDKYAYLKPITGTKVPLATASALLYVDGNYRTFSLLTHSDAPNALPAIDLLEEKYQPLILKARKNVLHTNDLYAITDGKHLLFSEDPLNARVTYNEPLISKLLQSVLLSNPSETAEKFSWDEFYALKIEATDVISNDLCSLGIKIDSGVLVLPTISENGTTLGFANDDLFKLVYKLGETDITTKDFRNMRANVLKEIFKDNSFIEMEYDELQHTSDKATFHILGNTLSSSGDIPEDVFSNIKDALPEIRDAAGQNAPPYEPLYQYLNRAETAPIPNNDTNQKPASESMPIGVDTFREVGDLSVASVFTVSNAEKIPLPGTCYYFLDGQLTIRDVASARVLPSQVKYLKIVHNKDTGKPAFAFCDEAGNEYGAETKLIDAEDILLNIRKDNFDLEKMHTISGESPVFSLEPDTASNSGISSVALFPTYKNYLYNSQPSYAPVGNLVTSSWAITEDNAHEVDYKTYEGSLLHVYHISPRLQNFSQHVVKWDSRVKHADSIPYKLTLVTESNVNPLYIAIDGNKVAFLHKNNTSDAAFHEDTELSAVLRESCDLKNDQEKFTVTLTLRENSTPHAPHHLPILITKIDTSPAARHEEHDNTGLFLDVRNYAIHLIKNQQDVEVVSTTPWSSAFMNAVLPHMLKIEVSNDEETNLRSYKLVYGDGVSAHLPEECVFLLDKLTHADVPAALALGAHNANTSQPDDVIINPQPDENALNADNVLLEWTDANLHHVFTNLPLKPDASGLYPLCIHANYNDVLTFYQNVNTKYQDGEYSYDEALALYDNIVLASCNNETFCVPYGHIDHTGNVLVGEHHFGHIEGIEKMFNM